MRRIATLALALGLTGLAACGTAAAQDSSTSSTVASVPSTTTTELTAQVGPAVHLSCTDATDDVAASYWLSDQLVERCDWRLHPGVDCPEDAICALAEIRETGDFTG